MTKDEILNMEAGREMDALIAEKVMGAKWINNCLRYSEDDKWMARILCGVTIHARTLPRFSEDIAAAWQVVEKVRGSGRGGFYFEWREDAAGKHTIPWALFVRRQEPEDDDWQSCEAPTAPLAICRAALLAVMDGKS